jgi:chemotaxis protein MotB
MTYDPNVIPAPRSPSAAPWMLLFVVIAGAGAGGAWLLSQRASAQSTAAAAGHRADVAEAAAKQATERAQKAETDKTQLETEKAELSAANKELSRDVEAKAGELAQLKGTADKLQEQMKDEIAKGDIKLTESGGKLRVALVDKVLFESGEAQVSKRGEGVLARVGAVLAQIDDKQIQVSGHTDNTPLGGKLTAQYPSNWELSAARAINVVRFLAEKANVPPQRLVASGYGEYQPVASNKSGPGRARNRRIEILLTPLLDPKLITKGKLDKLEKTAQKSPGGNASPVADAGPRASRGKAKRK